MSATSPATASTGVARFWFLPCERNIFLFRHHATDFITGRLGQTASLLRRIAGCAQNSHMNVPTLASVLEGREEVLCPICSRPLVVSPLADGKVRFDGCGRNCVPMYWVLEDSIILGPQGGAMTVYRRKWLPDEPGPTLLAKHTNGGW